MRTDIGANLTDSMYQGEYRGTSAHEPDLDAVLARAWAAGVEKIIITAGTLSDARTALDLARTDPRLFCTVGVHPTRCNEFESAPEGGEAYLLALKQVGLSCPRSSRWWHACPRARLGPSGVPVDHSSDFP